MIEEAVVLAGGMGTRLRPVVSDLPKPLAAVAGRPFLSHLLDFLESQGVRRVVLSVGYRGDLIVKAIGTRHGGIEVAFCSESEPLGTGGAIRLSLDSIRGSDCFVVNGDTLLKLDFAEMATLHRGASSKVTIAVRKVADSGRYGRVEVSGGRIRALKEKGADGGGLINGGVYLVRRDLFSGLELPVRFSFEADFLPGRLEELRPVAFETAGYFIDIGIPEDYRRAGRELSPGSPERSASPRREA